MTLSVEDEVTIAEVVVILIGIVVTWAVYYRGGGANTPSAPEPDASRETEENPAEHDRRTGP